MAAAGCNQQDSGKPTPQEMQSFRGDPSKMPDSIKMKIAADQNAAVQKAAQSANASPSNQPHTQ